MAQVVRASMDEMVFEDRERRYGAFFLRKNYPLHLGIGVLVISLLTLGFSYGPLLIDRYGLFEGEVKKVREVKKLVLEELPPPPPLNEDTPPPPPPPQAPPPEVRTVEFRVPEPVPEEEADEDQEVKEVKELEKAPNFGAEDKDGEDVGIFSGELGGDGKVPDVIVDNDPGINDFVSVEQEPVPVNIDDIKSLIGYPQIARDAGIQGQVVVRVLVDKTGNYDRHRIVKSVHPILDEAVSQQLSKLKFTPAIQGGRPIKFWVNIPFNFKLLN
ncbi:MAG: TonB family protein [Bacteroidia bacterium]|nr:TonB family protein [Bacteroidia bacterium]